MIKHTPPVYQYQLVNKLCTQEYGGVVIIKQLADKIDDAVVCFGDQNYFSEITKLLIKYYGKVPNILTDMDASTLTNAKILDYKNRIVTFNYTGFVKRLFTSCGASLTMGGNGATISNTTMVKDGNTWKVNFEDQLQVCFFNVQSSNHRSYGIMEPLIVSDDARLMDLFSENGQATTMPAFVLYFLNEKAWAKTAVEAVETAIDALTLVIPGAQSTKFLRILNYADKMSSTANVFANYTEQDNPMLGQLLAITSGVLGIGSLTATGVNKFRTLSSSGNKANDILSLVTRKYPPDQLHLQLSRKQLL